MSTRFFLFSPCKEDLSLQFVKLKLCSPLTGRNFSRMQALSWIKRY